MIAALQLQAPSEDVERSFINYLKYEVNPKRIKRGLDPITLDQAREYLTICWDFANRLGTLKTPTT